MGKFFYVWVNVSVFNISHKNFCVGLCAGTAHCATFYLKIISGIKTKIVKWIFSNNFFWNSFVYRFIRIFDISVERLFSIVTWKLLSGTCSMVFILLRKWFLSLIYEKISLIIGCRWKSRHSEIFEGWLMIALITGFLGIFLSWTLEMFSIFKCVSNFLFFSLIF